MCSTTEQHVFHCALAGASRCPVQLSHSKDEETICPGSQQQDRSVPNEEMFLNKTAEPEEPRKPLPRIMHTIHVQPTMGGGEVSENVFTWMF